MKHRVLAMYIAAKLSLLSGMGRMEDTCSSKNSLVSHESSAVIARIDLYSTFAEERATMGCFLDFHEIGLPPNMMKNPLTDLLVQGH